MKVADSIFRFCSLAIHRFTAWNTNGEGVHSPSLFYLVRYLFYDTNRYYVFDEIENRRMAMSRAPKVIRFVDFGTGARKGVIREELVSNIARTSLMSPKYAQILFRIVQRLGNQMRIRENRPLSICELGTSLGLTTAYLASPDSHNSVITFDGCPDVLNIAQLNWGKLGISNIRSFEGNIDETLKTVLPDMHEKLDFVLVDANHAYLPTVRYWEHIRKLCGPYSVVALDDIRYSREMFRAWKRICLADGVTASIDLGTLGLVFFEPHLEKRTYRIKV